MKRDFQQRHQKFLENRNANESLHSRKISLKTMNSAKITMLIVYCIIYFCFVGILGSIDNVTLPLNQAGSVSIYDMSALLTSNTSKPIAQFYGDRMFSRFGHSVLVRSYEILILCQSGVNNYGEHWCQLSFPFFLDRF